MRGAKALRHLARDTREWVATGIVTAASDSPDYGLVVTVQLLDGRLLDARPIIPGVGDTTGTTVSFDVGAEVIVLLPQGDVNQALVMTGCTNREQQPDTWEQGKQRTVQPNGSEYRTTAGSTVSPVATYRLVVMVSRLVSAIDTFARTVSGLTTPTTLPEAITAIEGISTAATVLDTALLDLGTELTIALLRGGDPFATPSLAGEITYSDDGTPL